MSYLRKIEYTIIPEESFRILRNCSGCGCKMTYHNTNCFRVNANGNRIDVWLIYQCVKCKHSYNLTIYERRRPESISKQEYEKFLSNSAKLAFEYGTDSQFFVRNKAEVDWTHMEYIIKSQKGIENREERDFHKGDFIVVSNSYVLKVRIDRIVSEILNITRSRIKVLKETKIITVTEDRNRHRIMIELDGEIYD